MRNSRSFVFAGGEQGSWRVTSERAIAGDPLAPAQYLSVIPADEWTASQASEWILRGTRSNERYSTRDEKQSLSAIQPQLARPEATCAALIPIRKLEAWWDLSQDERRRIFEERSSHIAIGSRFLPAIARRLYHCRDLETAEPFDFITWFEFAPSAAATFDELLAALRASLEWSFVEREVEIRLERDYKSRAG